MSDVAPEFRHEGWGFSWPLRWSLIGRFLAALDLGLNWSWVRREDRDRGYVDRIPSIFD